MLTLPTTTSAVLVSGVAETREPTLLDWRTTTVAVLAADDELFFGVALVSLAGVPPWMSLLPADAADRR